MESPSPQVVCVVGTRPEVIKLAPVVRELRRAGVDTVLIATGQHKELTHDALATFGLAADVDLAVMTVGQTPTSVAARVLDGLGPVLATLSPRWLIVQGDTTTVLAATLAAAYAQVPVAHVEAGLRSHRFDQPFPEEINRRAVSAMASLHFAPTERAAAALRAEGAAPEAVLLTGNTVIDALYWACAHLPPKPLDAALEAVDEDRPVVLLTTHRRENFGSGLDRVFEAVRRISDCRPEAQFVFPVHPNPVVRDAVETALGDVGAVIRTAPLAYLDLAWVLTHCRLVLTDSGGLQEEAPAMGKRVLVLREVTERPEAVEVGMAELVGTDTDRIVGRALDALDRPLPFAASPYGDGRAAERIVAALLNQPMDPFVPPGSAS